MKRIHEWLKEKNARLRRLFFQVKYMLSDEAYASLAAKFSAHYPEMVGSIEDFIKFYENERYL